MLSQLSSRQSGGVCALGALRMMMYPEEAQREISNSTYFYSYQVRVDEEDLEAAEFNELRTWREEGNEPLTEQGADGHLYYLDLCKPLILKVGSTLALCLAIVANK